MDKKDKMEVTYEDGLTRISEQELGHETFMKAQNAISDGDYKTAIKEFESLAKKGHPIAQNNLGFEYLHGDRVDKDVDLGVYWLKKAAEQQVPDAEVGPPIIDFVVIGIQYLTSDLAKSKFTYKVNVATIHKLSIDFHELLISCEEASNMLLESVSAEASKLAS